MQRELEAVMKTSSKSRLQLVPTDSTTSAPAVKGPYRIGILALPNSALSDVAGPYETFLLAAKLGLEKSNGTDPAYEVTLLSIAGSAVETLGGLRLEGACPYTDYRGFPDTLIVVGEPDSLDPGHDHAALFGWIRQASKSCRRVCSVCTGVFCLAAAGVLNGKRVTTHWQHVETLARRFPEIEVDPEPVFLRDRKFYTSAGCTAALDLSLALIEEDLGVALATDIASASIMFLRRPGRQAQISPLLKLQMSDREPLRELQGWMLAHLHLPLTVEDLAEQVHMSPRNFARAFVAAVGVTPARFLETLRLEAARRRLEETDRNIDQVAAESGFGSAERMRRSFIRNLGAPPSAYRRELDRVRPQPA
jgi:transcriptional regulator GlxA family with amidase domain